jgi:hypothetical protein
VPTFLAAAHYSGVWALLERFQIGIGIAIGIAIGICNKSVVPVLADFDQRNWSVRDNASLDTEPQTPALIASTP